MTAVRLKSALLFGTAPALLLSACATQTVLPRADTLALGRNAANEPCVASRTWKDAGAPDAFSTSYFITCRNVTASRPLGALRVVATTPAALKPIDESFDCGQSSAVTVAGAPAQARRCVDRVLGLETVRVDVPMGRQMLVADASAGSLGPLEEGIALLLGTGKGGDAGRTTTPTIDVTTLAAAPAATPVASGEAGTVDPATALAQGIALNHRGLHVDASRVLNDALSRLPVTASAATRAELQLEAGLADSNISFADSAREHFTQADALIDRDTASDTAFLRRKRDAYRALDLLNRRQFRASLASLDQLVSGTVAANQPLMDLATVRRLNQSARSDATTNAVALPDTAELSQVVLDAQANWARSVALLAIGDVAASSVAIGQAASSYDSLRGERIDQAPVLWLGARIERQRGRLAARNKDWPTALAGFDRALDYLRRGSLATAGTGAEPAIAETQLERAGVFAKSGADPQAVRTAYGDSVDALIASRATGSGVASGMDAYLDLLAAEAKAGGRDDTYERYFRALQSTGEPAVARQFSQLRTIVSADADLSGKVRERAEVEREVTRLRYAINEAGRTPGTDVAALEQQRQTAETRLFELDASLTANTRYNAIDDRPATVAEIRAALKPGEAFFKVAELDRRAFAIFIGATETYVYSLARNERELRVIDGLGASIRASIDGKLDQGKLVPFDTASAYGLFGILSGPAREAMLKATSLVVDPSGPLKNIPVGVLVTQFDPKKANRNSFDYSKTAFLAGRTTISTAISPRSFLVARALPASTAKKPFLGLGEHQAPGFDGDQARAISVGFGCSVPYGNLANLSRSLAPISKRELTVAADALGVPAAPMVTDAAFTDSAIEKRNDLGDYEVLHFATHGLEEGQWGCSKSPPALVTSFGDAESDGLLSFSEIARLRLDANLVVLSACDTASGVKDEALARASGQEEAGSTLEGLVRAFLAANARAVLATYWQVSAEQESEDFIKVFYRSARNRTIGGALQEAQRTLMTQPKFSHPFYWAPYFVFGDASKPMLTGTVFSAPPAVAR